MKQRTAGRNHLARLLLGLALAVLAGLFLPADGLDSSRSVYAADASGLSSGRSARSRVNASLSAKSADEIELSDTVILATNSIQLNSETDILQ